MFSAIVGLEPCESVTETEVTGQGPSVLPRDVATFNFESEDDIRNMMLTKSDVATVISSYEKTIGLHVLCYFCAIHSCNIIPTVLNECVPRVGFGAHVCYHCRISPPRFLTECRKRRLNQGSFVLLFLGCLLCLICI